MITYHVHGIKNGGAMEFRQSTVSESEALAWNRVLQDGGYIVNITATGSATEREKERIACVIVLVACIIGAVLCIIGSLIMSRRNLAEIERTDSFLMEVAK